MVNRYALITRVEGEAFGLVKNVIYWDGVNGWTPPEETTVVMVDEGWKFGVGDAYYFEDSAPFVAGQFYRPVTPDPEVDADGYMIQNGTRLTDTNGQWITSEAYYA